MSRYSYSVTKVYLSLNECLFFLVADWRPVLGELTGFCDHPFWLANPHKSASDYKDGVKKTLGKQQKQKLFWVNKLNKPDF